MRVGMARVFACAHSGLLTGLQPVCPREVATGRELLPRQLARQATPSSDEARVEHAARELGNESGIGANKGVLNVVG